MKKGGRTVVHPIPPAARRLSSSERPPPRGIRKEGRNVMRETRNPTGSSMRLRDRDGCQKLAYLPSREDASDRERRSEGKHPKAKGAIYSVGTVEATATYMDQFM